jgi:hypothetical protein
VSPALLAFRAALSSRRAERRSAMATAPKKSPAPRRVAFPADGASDAEAMRFLVFEDNTGGYRCMIVGEAGGCLAQSEPTR